MSTRIKTNIKFQKGLNGGTDKVYGFVTKTSTKSWRGCRENEPKKKIVLVDAAVSRDIVPNVLYSCSLIPMRSDSGFIAKSASIVKFKATIVTSCTNSRYAVSVRFGNRNIVYDPASKEKNKKDISSIADMLRHSLDLENANTVAEDFINSACLIKHLYEQSLPSDHVHGQCQQ